jgi:hypothetical protein
LSQLVLFFSDYLVLNEEEGEKGSDHIVESPDSRHNIVIFDIVIFSNRVLSMLVVDLLDPILDIFILRVAQECVVDKQLPIINPIP